MGTLGTALKQAGISPAITELRVALSKFINQGGTCAQLRAEVDAIERMSGMGQPHGAVIGCATPAQTRQPVEGGGAMLTVPPQGQTVTAPSPSFHRGGEGQPLNAESGPHRVALPVREPVPSVTKRGLSSILLVQPTIEKGLLYTKKRSDGAAWAFTGWHELDGLDRDGAISRMIKQKANPPKNRFAELREVLSNKQFEEICNAAEKQNDHINV